jgi:hypothetical protein
MITWDSLADILSDPSVHAYIDASKEIGEAALAYEAGTGDLARLTEAAVTYARTQKAVVKALSTPMEPVK